MVVISEKTDLKDLQKWLQRHHFPSVILRAFILLTTFSSLTERNIWFQMWAFQTFQVVVSTLLLLSNKWPKSHSQGQVSANSGCLITLLISKTIPVEDNSDQVFLAKIVPNNTHNRCTYNCMHANISQMCTFPRLINIYLYITRLPSLKII